jgi:hypothetical protein
VSLYLNNSGDKDPKEETRILFLHHSTGQNIWNGDRSTILSKIVEKTSHKVASKFCKDAVLQSLFREYNKKFGTSYRINELTFPKRYPYGWHNYPFDYYNIWVKNAGDNPFMEEPTLEMLTKKYQVIIFKHCFPVSNIQPDKDKGNVNSDYKSLANYKLQYLELREKLSGFPETKFIVFTGAARVKSQITTDEATRAREFFDWVVNDWDVPDDNIHIWDLYNLQTEGDLFFKDDYACSYNNSHPDIFFSDYVSKLLFNRIIDVIKTNGSATSIIGQTKTS